MLLLVSYEPRQSVIHRLDPRLKVIYPVLIGVLSIFLNWDFVYYLVAFTLIPWMLLRPSPARLRVIITMAGIPVIGAIWSQGEAEKSPSIWEQHSQAVFLS